MKLLNKKLFSCVLFGCIFIFCIGCSASVSSSERQVASDSNNFPAPNSITSTNSVVSNTQDTSDFNEEHFTASLSQLCRFVNEPISSAEDLKSLDLFYCVVALAEDFAGYQGKTYSTNEEISSYLFPLEDLKYMSNMLFGFELDFDIYQDDLYFTQAAHPADHFQSDSNAFFIVFSDPYRLVKDGVSTSLLTVLSIKANGTQIDAECELARSKGLGEELSPLTLTYHFEMLTENGMTFYRLQSVN